MTIREGEKGVEDREALKGQVDLSTRLSVIFITDDTPVDSDALDVCNRMGCPLFEANLKNQFKAGHKGLEQITLIKSHNGFSSLMSDPIKTPWVLLLEPNEFVKPSFKEVLKSLMCESSEVIWQASIQRFVSENDLKAYEWVTSVGFAQSLGNAERSFYSIEPRLVPREALETVLIHPKKRLNHPSSIENKDIHGDLSKLVIHRHRQPDKKREASHQPGDAEIFTDGHTAHFDDTRFSSKFLWPAASYKTMRMEHIPGIETGLDQGWGTPEIIGQAISYLLSFGHHEKAYKIFKKIPEGWIKNDPTLGRLGLLAAFSSGRKKEACQAMENLDISGGDGLDNALEIAKIQLLLGQEEKALKGLYEIMARVPKDNASYNNLKNLALSIERNEGARASLSLCLVVKDEEEHIRQCLSSVQAVADEIIVLDTGSTDNTKEIANTFGAEVYSQIWTDDFSAARNRAIDKASGDYIFMIDADEYVPPGLSMNLCMLKALLPVKEYAAFSFTIAHIQTRHNWLFFVRAINPRVEGESIRIFPRVSKIRYKGIVEEDIESSLKALEVPVFPVPTSDLYLLHEPKSRQRRILRKIHLYEKAGESDPMVMRAVVREVSNLEDKEPLIHWLKKIDANFGHQTWAWPYSFRLGEYLQTIQPDQAENIYRRILGRDPNNLEGQKALAEILITTSKLDEIREIGFRDFPELDTLDISDRSTYRSYLSLAAALEGNLESAASYLHQVLDENPVFLLGQAVRFYVLIKVGDIEGAVSALQDILVLTSDSDQETITPQTNLLELIDRTGRLLLDQAHLQESRLIQSGRVILEDLIRKLSGNLSGEMHENVSSNNG